MTVGGIAAIVAGAASASALLPTGTDTLEGPAAVQPAGGDVHISPAIPDPGGGPAWAVRVYQSQTGRTCPEAGRLGPDGFGTLQRDGSVTPTSVQAAGSCADLSQAPMAFAVNTYPAAGDQPERSVLFGVVSARVRALSLVSASGTRAVEPDDAGAFLVVLPPKSAGEQTLTVTVSEGDTLTYRLVAPLGATG